MEILSVIDPKLSVIIVVLYLIGMACKQTNMVNDKYIPVILGAFGILFVSLFLKVLSIDSVIQGILCAAASVYGNQILKQLSTK